MTAATDLAQTIELDVQGMTCASCAARIERKLNRLDGVLATVNYATEKASVHAAPSVSPETLIATIEQTGYAATLPAAASPDDPGADPAAPLRRRMLGAAVLSVPVVVLAMLPAAQFPGWPWVAAALALPVVTWAAWPFHRAAALNLRHGSTTMDTLVSAGVVAATAWSAYALAFGGHLYLETAVVITTFLLIGRHLEARAKRRSGAAIRALLALAPTEATVLRDGDEVLVPAARLRVGDTIVVRPGERIAADGTVTEGRSAVDAATVTGEPVPVDVAPGDAVVGGTINTHGRLLVRADRVGANTELAQIARLVEAAQTGKAQVQRLADRVAGVFVPVVIGIALLTFGAWLVSGAAADTAFSAAVAVLIIACPCALGLATPTALLVGTGRGAQLGVLIRGPEVLEATRRIDTVVLDKTGTVTSGHLSVVAVLAHGTDERLLVAVAGAAESGSEHPIARAVTAYARAAGPLPALTGLSNRPGLGVVAELSELSGVMAQLSSDTSVVVGRAQLLEAEGLKVPGPVGVAYAAEQGRGRTVLMVGWGGTARGVLALADTVKPGSAAAVRGLRTLGLHPVLLTGDGEAAAAAVAAEVGISDVVAGVLPQQKLAEIVRRQGAGARVAMVGDGVNDAAALAQADLGIAMGTGTDAAIEAADLTLVRGDLRAAVDAIRLSRATLRTIQGNLVWASAYNVAAIPVAAAGLLNPMIAAAAMALSSLFVVGNSLRLLRFRGVEDDR